MLIIVQEISEKVKKKLKMQCYEMKWNFMDLNKIKVFCLNLKGDIAFDIIPNTLHLKEKIEKCCMNNKKF